MKEELARITFYNHTLVTDEIYASIVVLPAAVVVRANPGKLFPIGPFVDISII